MSVRPRHRVLHCQPLERRQMLAASMGLSESESTMDVNSDGSVTARDALAIINILNDPGRFQTSGEPIDANRVDVNGDGNVTGVDVLRIINYLNQRVGSEPGMPVTITDADIAAIAKAPGVATGTDAAALAAAEFAATFDPKDQLETNLLTEADVNALLARASQATQSEDAIIAVVDRNGRILGVRVEADVSATLQQDPKKFAYAIDGAVAKARTAAFFSSNAAPLTSRTIRFISQSTNTQREVESSPTNTDPKYQGPGFVAPIGVGGHFPPEIPFAPQVDLFAIEHQSRDSQTHPGADGIRGNEDDFELQQRFNADPAFVPAGADAFFRTWPESFGEQSGMDPTAAPRGIATLPGGIPLFKTTDLGPNLVGGIGVFFPGEDGYATYEQGFEPGIGQTERERTNAPKVLEAEYAAFVASAGQGIVAPPHFGRDISDINAALQPLDRFVALSSRIDLVGLTLEIYGPTPTPQHRIPGIDRMLSVGRSLGPGMISGDSIDVGLAAPDLKGQPVPEGWLVAPHDSSMTDGLTANDVQQIIETGVTEANRTRAAIRLNSTTLMPGAETRMVLSVADTNGELLGLFRMPDATIFSIDVSVAKSRNTAYYADPADIQEADRVDFNGDGMFGETSQSLKNRTGDTLPLGTALTSRSFRFLSEPRFPTGTELSGTLAVGCDQTPTICLEVGPQSMLRLPGINPLTGENLLNNDPLGTDSYAPLDFSVYASPLHSSTKAFDAFNVMRNFRDPGDVEVSVNGNPRAELKHRLANQNGVVFFPGSTAIYVDGQTKLAGGFGVSGDGVDQDDVVTAAGQEGFAPPQAIRVDSFTIGGVRVPFQKFNRNPFSD